MRLKTLVACVIVACSAVPAWSYDFTYQNLLTASMKLNPNFDYENIVDSYMQAFRPAIWQRSHDDEFERHGKEVETLDMMKKSAESFNLDEPISIRTNIQFGEYDFKKHEFALDPFTEVTFFQQNYCCNNLPRQIRLFFSNPDIIDGLPMDDQAARNFLQHRKQYGNVNRQLVAELSVKLESVKSDGSLVGIIRKAVIHDPMNKGAVLETLTAKNGS